MQENLSLEAILFSRSLIIFSFTCSEYRITLSLIVCADFGTCCPEVHIIFLRSSDVMKILKGNPSFAVILANTASRQLSSLSEKYCVIFRFLEFTSGSVSFSLRTSPLSNLTPCFFNKWVRRPVVLPPLVFNIVSFGHNLHLALFLSIFVKCFQASTTDVIMKVENV